MLSKAQVDHSLLAILLNIGFIGPKVNFNVLKLYNYIPDFSPAIFLSEEKTRQI